MSSPLFPSVLCLSLDTSRKTEYTPETCPQRDEPAGKAGVLTLLEADMNAPDLPGRPLLPLGCRTVLEQVIRQVQSACYGGMFLVTFPDTPANAPLQQFCTERAIPFDSGPYTDALDQALHLVRQYEAAVVVRCRDNAPFLEPRLFDACVRYTLDSSMDYVTVARMPEGTAVESVPARTLLRTDRQTEQPAERDDILFVAAHNPHLYERAYLPPPPRFARPDLRLALDNRTDYRAQTLLFEQVPPCANGLRRLEDVLVCLDNDPRLRHYRAAPIAKAA